MGARQMGDRKARRGERRRGGTGRPRLGWAVGFPLKPCRLSGALAGGTTEPCHPTFGVLHVACCLCVACFMLHVACCMLHDVWCMLHVVCCLLCVMCCMRIACCILPCWSYVAIRCHRAGLTTGARTCRARAVRRACTHTQTHTHTHKHALARTQARPRARACIQVRRQQLQHGVGDQATDR